MTNKAIFIQKLKTIVMEYYTDEQFGVSDLVTAFGLSRSQLHRKLKATTGQSISQFIREIRLDEALKLLQDEDVTASEVAYKVGFNSPTYFNTCFNEYFGYPPGEVKHQVALGVLGRNAEVVTPKSPKKNRTMLYWLMGISAVVAGFFLYQYSQHEDKQLVTQDNLKPKTIAVLPFKNWSGDPDLEYVSDGMTDAVIRRLNAISDIDKVVPFTSCLAYKNSDKTAAEIAKELSVEYLLIGNFKLSGDQVMSNLDLIQAKSNTYLWSLEYKGIWRTDQIFEMQAQVAENVAKNMSAEISMDELKHIGTIPTNNAEAYKSFLKAEFNYEKLSPVGFDTAEGYYKQAIELDSSFIEPYLGLATNYYISGLVWGGKSQEVAKREGNRYLELSEKLNIKKGKIYEDSFLSTKLFRDFYYNWDFLSLSRQVKLLQEKNNRELLLTELAGLIEYHRKFGYFDKAIEYGIMSLEKGRAEAGIVTGLSYAYYLKGETDKARDLLHSYDATFTTDFFYLMESAKVYFYLMDFDKSKHQLDLFISNFQAHPPIVVWLRAVHADMDKDIEATEKYLSKLNVYYNQNVSGSPGWFLALYYCQKNNFEEAFRWLAKAYEHHEVELTWLKEEPMLQPVKNDPRYIKLYEKMGFQYVNQEQAK